MRWLLMKKEAPLRKTIHPPCWIEPVVKNARVSEHNRCLHSINKRRKKISNINYSSLSFKKYKIIK